MREKPDWIKSKITVDNSFQQIRETLDRYGLYTVCDGARCPNKSECWGCGTATFMILGGVCTRNCRFCAVKKAQAGEVVNPDEPENLSTAVSELGLKYVVLTSVDRDDLTDKGSGHYAECIRAVKKTGAKVEALIPDYADVELATVLDSRPDVLAHNIEVVERLQPLRDARASYQKSIRTLTQAKGVGATTKSSIMLGLGETETEVLKTMKDLRNAGCDMLVIGQYLQPTKQQVKVKNYLLPCKFTELGEKAKEIGFQHVVSKPLARTSYKASENTFK